jgi:hypothetical protein
LSVSCPQRRVKFLNGIGNHDAADQFSVLDARQYTEHSGPTLIANPHRRYPPIPRAQTKIELLNEARDCIADLEAKLDDIAGLASGEDEDDEDVVERIATVTML